MHPVGYTSHSKVQYLIINGRLADIHDMKVMMIRDDGTEEEMHHITRVRWEVGSNGEPATAQITFMNVELDAEVEYKAPWEEVLES